MSDERPGADSEKWRRLLTGEESSRSLAAQRALFRHLPSAPHCKLCEVPLRGIGAAVFAPMGFRQWPKSPRFCQACRRSLAKFGMGGAEVPATLLFADLRGSTSLGERISAAEYGALINRFYLVVDKAIADHHGIVEQHVGDAVVGLFLPLFAGDEHGAEAIHAARQLVAGARNRDQSLWAPVGVGIATGIAYVGVVSTSDEPDDLTALGDVVNTAARLSGAASAGEILVNRETALAAGIATDAENTRTLELKGKQEPFEAFLIH